jgi:hypothetical protein
MTTVLFADRDASAFGALDGRTVPALLPLQGTPALEHAIEALVKAGIRSALVVVGPRAQEIERRFGKGIRWGIALEWVRREDGESCGDVLRRVEHRLDGETLAFRGDVGSHGAFGEFVREVEDRTEPFVAAVAGGRPAGMWRLAPGTLKKADLPREPASDAWTLGKDDAPLALSAEPPLLDSVRAYRRADRAEKPAVSPRGDVEDGAKLGPGTTVAEDAIVLRGASLTETSVLPRTVIPSGVSLANAVVSANVVVDAESGAVSRLSDLLPVRAGAMPQGPSLGSRLAGVVALVLSIPLWPIAFLWALLANAGHATRRFTLVGNAPGRDEKGRPNRAPFPTFRFETAVPVLRDLPLLLALAAGRLALSGVGPLTPQEQASLKEEWEEARFEAPVGLLSRSRLSVPASAPPEVARLVDSFEARRPSGGLLSLGVSSLFGARGWTAPRVWNPDELPEKS